MFLVTYHGAVWTVINLFCAGAYVLACKWLFESKDFIFNKKVMYLDAVMFLTAVDIAGYYDQLWNMHGDFKDIFYIVMLFGLTWFKRFHLWMRIEETGNK
ncbi:hypothetical protein ACT4YP_20405 (plasmid) [Acinetobacter baumannii]